MKRTIIFLSGLAVPKMFAKSKYVWNDSLWEDYNRIYITSRIPTSDVMVEEELERLTHIVNRYPEPIVAGHSLGGWWASNLACCPKAEFAKLVLLTPLANANRSVLFNVTPYFHPCNRVPNPTIYGPHRVLVNTAKHDLIVPTAEHSDYLARHFNATKYELKGGHYYQTNHDAMLEFMKTWITI
jgi:predicted esterase